MTTAEAPARAQDQRLTFDGPGIAQTFRSDEEKRTISGLAVPWALKARNGFGYWRFLPDSLHWSAEDRVKLNVHHDPTRAIGFAARLQSLAQGLDATFKIARGEEGDRALTLAADRVLDGFSIEIHFGDGDGYVPDPEDPGVNLVQRATLTGVALTAIPAFDDARATAVHATRDGGVMTTQTQEAPPSSAGFERRMEEILREVAGARDTEFERLGTTIKETIQGFTQAQVEALENLARVMDRPAPAPRAGIRKYSHEVTYRMDGKGPSLIRDVLLARTDPAAAERLRTYDQQVAAFRNDVINGDVDIAHPDLPLQFATVTTTVGANLMPTAYRPDLYVRDLAKLRPLASMLRQGTIENAQPFTLPRFGVLTGGVAAHVEGTNPGDGTITFTNVTVTPGAISGIMNISREAFDAMNPMVDQIIMDALRERYSQQTEANVYTLLNGANGVGGTITAGFVPSGAQVATTTGGSAAAGTFGGLELLRGLRNMLALYPFRRFSAPDAMAASQEATQAFAGAADSQNRFLIPMVGASNAEGIARAGEGDFFPDGLSTRAAWSMTGNAAGDADIIIVNEADALYLESPVLTFTYEEKLGPAIIQLAIFGYTASAVIRPVGLAAIRHTVGA